MMRAANTRTLTRAALLLLFCIACAACVTCAGAKLAWANFSVYVGYPGGPYYEKTEYSDADMQVMSGSTLYEYSSFDKMPALRKGFAYGVPLSQFFVNTGINSSQLFRFYFSTQDGYVADDGGDGYGAWYYSELCETTRYYYPRLYEGSEKVDGEYILDPSVVYDGAVTVPTVIAYKSSFNRVFSETDWTTPDFRDGYRLMFGQTDPLAGNARASADNVISMTCIFQGTPKISFGDQTSFSGEVGDVITITPTVEAADPLIEQEMIKDIKWQVSDTSVVQFVTDSAGNLAMDENGNFQLKIVGKGSATLSASYGNSPLEKYIARASAGVSGTGGDGDESDDKDTGGSGGGTGTGTGASSSGSGSGDAEGSGDGGNTGFGASTVGGGGGSSTGQAETKADTNAEAIEITSAPQSQSRPQAWVIDNASAFDQSSMVDDPLLVARPAVLALVLFGFFVLACILRVIKCEREKDPYVDARLQSRAVP